MALSSTSFSKILPELDDIIEAQMEAIVSCDNLDQLEEYEERLHERIEALDMRQDKLRKMQRELTKKQRGLIAEIKNMLVGSNRKSESERRQHINTVHNHGGVVNFHQEVPHD